MQKATNRKRSNELLGKNLSKTATIEIIGKIRPQNKKHAERTEQTLTKLLALHGRHGLRQRMTTLDEVLLKMRSELAAAGVETPALDARLLMRQGGGFSDADLIAGGSRPLLPEVIEKKLKLLSRRLEGEPISRIAGGREFYGREFKVTKDTLDPRPDTETLIDAALKTLSLREREGLESALSSQHPKPSQNNLVTPALCGGPDARTGAGMTIKERGLKILDLGTGTGCILITLLAELPHATGVAVDLSPAALAVSRENAVRHGVESRIDFRLGSWFDPLGEGESFDLIVSNPPYIPESDIANLAKDVREYDPFMALSGGTDGLDAYKIILGGMKKHLGCGGFALFEIGQNQEKDLARLVGESNMQIRESYRDLGGVLRVLEIACGEK